jgi:hypothetical protein
VGAWGTGPFDNDDASDWVYELEGGGIATVESALSEALAGGDLVVPTDTNALAAGEVIAAALGHPAAGLREDIVELANGLAESVTADHAARARTAAERVLAGSELAGLWSESDDDAEWRGTVDDLIRRLAA